MEQRSVIERAFELARSRQFRSVVELRRALSREGYANAVAHLDGRYIKEQLAAVAKGSKPPPPACPRKSESGGTR